MLYLDFIYIYFFYLEQRGATQTILLSTSRLLPIASYPRYIVKLFWNKTTVHFLARQHHAD